jgi:hypothetical protein
VLASHNGRKCDNFKFSLLYFSLTFVIVEQYESYQFIRERERGEKERKKERGIVQEGEVERVIETIKEGVAACVREKGSDSKMGRDKEHSRKRQCLSMWMKKVI